jgi:hypothetical protein
MGLAPSLVRICKGLAWEEEWNSIVSFFYETHRRKDAELFLKQETWKERKTLCASASLRLKFLFF